MWSSKISLEVNQNLNPCMKWIQSNSVFCFSLYGTLTKKKPWGEAKTCAYIVQTLFWADPYNCDTPIKDFI